MGITNKMNKILSIIIPCYNKWNFTKSCLNDLSKLPNDHEIIIFDNGSTDETQKNLQNNKDIIYLRSDTNLGFAKANNISYSRSSAPNVLFLNNDIRVKENHDNWTKILIDNCENGLVGPTMGKLDDKFNFVQESNQILSGKSYMSGWCLASSKTIFNKLKIREEIFSEEFFCYFEDTDLSFRARILDIPMIVVPVPVVHFGKISSKQLNTYQLYFNAKNIFTKKWSE